MNTWYDFRKGVDTAATSDDRALVDRAVTPRAVALTAAALYAVGAVIGAYYASVLGAPIAVLGLLGGALGFFYTADPLSLKFLGLGDRALRA